MIVKTRLGALVAGTLAREPEIKTREYPEGSGKWYYNLDADGITPGDLTRQLDATDADDLPF